MKALPKASQSAEIQGVGFRAALQGKTLDLYLGYPKPVAMEVPTGLDVKVGENVNISITGADKQLRVILRPARAPFRPSLAARA